MLDQAVGETRYVSPVGTHTEPFLTWETAATDVCAVVSVSVDGDVILVEAGQYELAQLERHEYVLLLYHAGHWSGGDRADHS